MLSALLRSGDIKDYTALGQDGLAVYTVAAQLRDAIKIKRGRTFANYLAIPQRNDQGSKIDWYVPFESERPDGKYMIVPWTSATEEEREAALSELKVFERSILELGKEMAATTSNKGDQLLFARLLCGGNPSNLEDAENLKALRFPNPEHVYLVNDRPVITFWGFTEKHAEVHGSPFLNLKAALPKPVEQSVAPVATAATTAATATMVTQTHWCKRFWCLLPLLFGLLAFLAWFFRDLWLPKPELNVNLPKADLSLNEKARQLPKECEIRKVTGKSYYFVGNQWINDKGEVISDKTLLGLIDKTKSDLVGQCENVIPADITRLAREHGVVDSAWNPVNTVGNVDKSAVDSSGNLPVENKPLTENPMDAVPPADLNSTDKQNPLDPNKDGVTPADAQPPVDPNMDAKDPTNSNNADKKPEDLAKNDPLNPTDKSTTGKQPKPLEIPTDSQNNGNVDFLNGEWNAGAGIQDKTTGKPLRLSYKFDDGQGQVQVQRGDGVQCVGDVSAKMNGGSLNINNGGVAKCSDGSTYQLPNVSCKAGAQSSADCQGVYGQGQRFPMTMKSN